MFSWDAQDGSVLNPNQDGTFAKTAPGQFAYPGLAWTRVDSAGYAITVAKATHRLWRHMENKVHAQNATYLGQYYNEVTDAQIAAVVAAHSLNDAPRPTGWT